MSDTLSYAPCMATVVAVGLVSTLVVVVPVLVLLAGLLVLGAASRGDQRAVIGRLSRETRRADRTEPRPVSDVASGREIEHRAEIERSSQGGSVATLVRAPPAPFVPPDPETMGVTRRQFFNRGLITFFALGLSGFGAATLAFLWPKLGVGFGSVINLGSIQSVRAKIDDGDGFAYYPEGRVWVTQYPQAALATARRVYSLPELAGMEAGLVALYQKCPHLGCRVPECKSSQWFECQCHGSQYNQVGEKKGGPAPRGMDRFPMDIGKGTVTVDTGVIITGPPIGTNTTGQEAEGPHCVGAGSE
jgi:cytochrome b6-f complex iron-sulfur subunit